MAKTASISLRIEPAVKAQLEALYASFGISVTDAINIFLHTSLMEGGFPFQPKQPRYNAETEAAIQETKDILAGKIKAKSYANVKEMIEAVLAIVSPPITYIVMQMLYIRNHFTANCMRDAYLFLDEKYL